MPRVFGVRLLVANSTKFKVFEPFKRATTGGFITNLQKTSNMASASVEKTIDNLKADDSFIISEDSNGVILRSDIVDGNSVDTASELPGAQLVCLALNEAARKHGIGNFFWIPSREVRMSETDQGFCFNGGDLVYVPWV